MSSPRVSARALVTHNGAVLAIRAAGAHGDFYVLPGGGQNRGETLREAVVRECREELGVEVEVGELRFVHDYIAALDEFSIDGSDVHQLDVIFNARILSGEPGTGSAPDTIQLGIQWLPLDRLEEDRLYPKALRRLLNQANPPIYLEFEAGL